MNPTEIKGYGVDADPANRPGVPKESPPSPAPNARPPRPQQTPNAVFRRIPPGARIPPVYGTAQPPRGISGALRDFAYQYPAHKARHWLVLMFADRVDVLEHTVGLGRIAAVGGLFLGAATALRLRRRVT